MHRPILCRLIPEPVESEYVRVDDTLVATLTFRTWVSIDSALALMRDWLAQHGVTGLDWPRMLGEVGPAAVGYRVQFRIPLLPEPCTEASADRALKDCVAQRLACAFRAETPDTSPVLRDELASLSATLDRWAMLTKKDRRILAETALRLFERISTTGFGPSAEISDQVAL